MADTNGFHQISYSKHFLTGTLAGLSVRCSFAVPPSLCGERCAELLALTPDNPGSDVLTGAKFWVYNLGCTEAN